MIAKTDEQKFIDSILASPDDDLPRLVFADWLDERGQDDDTARAALIRAQCLAEQLPPDNKKRRKLEHTAKGILKEHGDRRSRPLQQTNHVREWTFRRGFLDGIVMSATVFAKSAKAVFEAAPTIRSAYFPDASNEVRRLANCRYLARLSTVNLQKMCTCGWCPIHNDLRALFNSKHTSSLTSLNIAGDRMDVEGVKRLVKSPVLKQLTTLDVSNNPFGDDGLILLSQAKNMKQLRTLNLAVTGFTAAGLETLGRSKHLPVLQHLVFQKCDITADALKTFVALPLFSQLVSLDLSKNRIGDVGAKVLAAIPETAKLESLDVRGCQLTRKGKELLKKRFGKGLNA